MKKLVANEKKIISGLFVSFITGYMLSAMYRGAYKNIISMDAYKESNFALTVISILLCTVAIGVVYYFYDNVARIVMFVSVYVFAILCAYQGNSIDWKTEANNTMGNTCFNAALCAIVVIAFLYVKDDLFKIISKLRIGKKATWIIVGIVGASLLIYIGAVTILRYETYSNSTYDFGIFAQMYESMIQRGTLETTVERGFLLSHFGVHFSPVIYLTYPIYVIFPSPVTVQVIQAIMVALPIIPITLISKKFNLSNWITVAMCTLYALYPATAGGTFYDMHENCFLAFGLLMVIWAVESKRNIWLVISLIFTYAIKEDVAIYILILGMYWLFSRKDKVRGTILMGTSIAYFIIAVSIVNSYGLGVLDMHFANLYLDRSGNMFEIVKTIITNPAYLLGEAITNHNENGMDKIEYIIQMLLPVIGVLFTFGKKYSRYILLAPLVVLNIFTTYLYQHSVTFHYNYGIIALIMYLVIMNVSEMKHKKAKSRMVVCVLCASIMFIGLIFPKLNWYVTKYADNKETYKIINQAIELIPEGTSISCSGYFMPHLADHLEVYDQSHVQEDVYTDYLVVDERYDHEVEVFGNLIASGQYESIYYEPGVVQVYQKIE